MCGPRTYESTVADFEPKAVREREKRRSLRLVFGDIKLTEEGNAMANPAISITNDNVEIGCTTVGRGVVEKLAAAFKEHFPVYGERRVKIQ